MPPIPAHRHPRRRRHSHRHQTLLLRLRFEDGAFALYPIARTTHENAPWLATKNAKSSLGSGAKKSLPPNSSPHSSRATASHKQNFQNHSYKTLATPSQPLRQPSTPSPKHSAHRSTQHTSQASPTPCAALFAQPPSTAKHPYGASHATHSTTPSSSAKRRASPSSPSALSHSHLAHSPRQPHSPPATPPSHPPPPTSSLHGCAGVAAPLKLKLCANGVCEHVCNR